MTGIKGVLLYCALLGGSLVLFVAAPGLDLKTSGLFYDPSSGFFLAHSPPFLFLHRAIPWLTRGLIVFVVLSAAWLFLMERPLFGLDRKALLFVVFAFALGPGLLVNTVLKDHWGRARPFEIEAFGGARRFSPAAVPSRQCPSNCSFVSGDAALAFGFLSFAFLLPAPQKRRGKTAAVVFGGAVGLARIAEGAHFLSDVVDAGLLVYGTTAILYRSIIVADAFSAPPFLRLCRGLLRTSRGGIALLRRDERARILFFAAATAAFVGLSIDAFDRPLAVYFHGEGPGFKGLFAFFTFFGLGYPYLLVFGLLFAGLHWGGALPRLRHLARYLRASSALPAFLFAAVAVSGIIVDLMKVMIGRTRPTLLFSSHLYAFTGFALRADHWSFPSGHTVTIVALMAALYRLWPRHLLFYILLAAIVAASRLAVGAHYLSDVVAAAFVGILSARGLSLLFARGGVDLDAARRGVWQGAAPWPCRLPSRRGGRDTL